MKVTIGPMVDMTIQRHCFALIPILGVYQRGMVRGRYRLHGLVIRKEASFFYVASFTLDLTHIILPISLYISSQ